MQMIVSSSGIPRVAHVSDSFALFREATFRQPFGISIKVRIVVNEFVVSAQLINRCPPRSL